MRTVVPHRETMFCRPCNKTLFLSQRAAERALERRRATGAARFYECPHHNYSYHLTSQM